MESKLREKMVAGLEVLELPGDPGGATIILLHGFGADNRDLVSLNTLFTGEPKPTWLFPNGPLKVPIMPGYNGHAWFPIDTEALQSRQFDAISRAFPPELSEARIRIERLIEELEIPRSKLILGGFSQGAVLAVDTALNGRDPVAGLVILSGTLICEAQWRRLSHLHAGTTFFQSHGTEDPLLPLEKSEALKELLQEGGLQGNLHIFEGGHEIPHPILSQLSLFLSKMLT